MHPLDLIILIGIGKEFIFLKINFASLTLLEQLICLY